MNVLPVRKGNNSTKTRIIKGWIGVQRFFSEPAGKDLRATME